jgi:hypothetical protein
VVFVTTLVYKLVLFSPRLCRGKGGTNAHVKTSLGSIANMKDMKHQGRGMKKTKGLNSIETEACLWCGRTALQSAKITPSQHNILLGTCNVLP